MSSADIAVVEEASGGDLGPDFVNERRSPVFAGEV
jgi:hypothetical protein